MKCNLNPWSLLWASLNIPILIHRITQIPNNKSVQFCEKNFAFFRALKDIWKHICLCNIKIQPEFIPY